MLSVPAENSCSYVLHIITSPIPSALQSCVWCSTVSVLSSRHWQYGKQKNPPFTATPFTILYDPVSVSFAGVRSEVLLHTLEDKGIYVSAGSACASNHPTTSGVLRAMGIGPEYLDSTLRFSFSEFTTQEEIDYTLETLYNCVPMLRRYTRH